MRSFTGVAAILVVAFPVCAQELPPLLEVGQRARVSVAATNTAVVGTVTRIGADSLILVTRERREAIPVALIVRLAAHRGRSNVPVIVGAVIGAAAGGVIGYAVAPEEECAPLDFDCGLGKGVAAALGAAFGALGGGALGMVARRDRWVDVPLDRLRAGVVPQRGGLGLGLAVRF